MQTRHRIVPGDARRLDGVDDDSVQLIVTSPPYPMIEMWDAVFSSMSPAAAAALAEGRPLAAFEAMHRELDAAWAACHRVLAPGGLAAINIGDATRSMGGEFALYPNHARILAGAMAAGFTVLPDVIWHKPTNAPNKFMGSGMLPAGAYVTYEHEYVLVLRKGGKRVFRGAEARAHRQRSAYFWEERNRWFSDLWRGLVGARQEGAVMDKALRARSAAFPLDLPLRLILMLSCYGDTVLDPFGGSGTTALAAAMTGRTSLCIEPDAGLRAAAIQRLQDAPWLGRELAVERLSAHRRFVAERKAAGKIPRHHNDIHDVDVITGQERKLELWVPVAITAQGPSTADAGAAGPTAIADHRLLSGLA